MRPLRSSAAPGCLVGIEQERTGSGCAKHSSNLQRPQRPKMNAKKFFTELKRRKVYRVAVAYAVLAWLVIQVTTQTFPFLEIPNWVVKLVIVLLALGFPVALLLSWAFDLTSKGVVRTDDIDETNVVPVAAAPIAQAPPPEKSIAG